MDNHQEFEQEMDTPRCLDHGVNGDGLVFIVIQSGQSKWKLLLSREMLQGTNVVLLMPWDPGLRYRSGHELENNLQNTEFFSQGVGVSSGSDVLEVIKWGQGKQANGGQAFTCLSAEYLGLLANFMWCWAVLVYGQTK